MEGGVASDREVGLAPPVLTMRRIVSNQEPIATGTIASQPHATTANVSKRNMARIPQTRAATTTMSLLLICSLLL